MSRTGKQIFGGIEKRVFLIFLITLALVFVVFMIISVFTMSKITNYIEQSNMEQKAAISWISSSTIEQVLQSDLARTSKMEAFLTDSIFNRIAGLSYSLSDVYEAVHIVLQYGIGHDVGSLDLEMLRPNPDLVVSLHSSSSTRRAWICRTRGSRKRPTPSCPAWRKASHMR